MSGHDPSDVVGGRQFGDMLGEHFLVANGAELCRVGLSKWGACV